MARRGNSEGSIFRRKDGRWAAAVSLPTGKRKFLYAKTRTEVAQKLLSAQNAVAHNMPLGDRTRMSAFLDRWLHESAKQTLRSRTFVDYTRIVHKHIAPEIGHLPVGRLAAPDVQGLLNRKLDAGLSASRVHAIHAVLSRALRQAERWEIVSRNVARLVDVPRPAPSKVEPLTPAQLRTFFAAIDGHRLSALYVLAATTGLREGECLGLTWDAVNLERGVLVVSASLQRIDGRLQLVEPKTERGKRTIVLPTIARDALRQHRRTQREERLKAGALWQEHGLVFTSETGTPIDGSNLVRQFKGLLRRAGLPERRFHDLRHGVATALFSQGVHLRKVADLLGHSQIAVTSEIYTHSVESGLQEVADKMEAVFAGCLTRAAEGRAEILR